MVGFYLVGVRPLLLGYRDANTEPDGINKDHSPSKIRTETIMIRSWPIDLNI